MSEPSGCQSFVIAIVVLVLSSIVGGLLALPVGIASDGGAGVVGWFFASLSGAMILPGALLMGTLGWAMISLPWVILRFFAPKLPEFASPRAIVGYLMVAPPVAAAAAYALCAGFLVSNGLTVILVVLFGAVAVPTSVVTALFARHGMLAFLAALAEGAS